MKVLKASIKPFEALQRSVKTKILLNFYFNTNSVMHRTGRVKCIIVSTFHVSDVYSDVYSEDRTAKTSNYPLKASLKARTLLFVCLAYSQYVFFTDITFCH